MLLGAMGIVGISGAAVFASSSASYTNHVLSGVVTSSGTHSAPAQTDHWWVNYGQSATWTFNVSALTKAIGGTVYLNLNALSAGQHWGAGFSSTIRVDVTGAVKGTYTTTLANPWKPHIAFNDPSTPDAGWNATASVALPKKIYTGANTLTVKVELPAGDHHIGFTADSLLIGYCTTP